MTRFLASLILVFGLIPALQSARTDLTSTLKETGGRSGSGFRQNKTRSVLVVTEVAEQKITVDGNHPLAGEDLTFDIELVAIA